MENKGPNKTEIPSWLLRDNSESPAAEARRDAKETSEEFREVIREKILKLTGTLDAQA